jgi:hypothetical protein
VKNGQKLIEERIKKEPGKGIILGIIGNPPQKLALKAFEKKETVWKYLIKLKIRVIVDHHKEYYQFILQRRHRFPATITLPSQFLNNI